MKFILILLTVFCLFSANISAQEIQEPEFVGETILVRQDNTTSPLEKHLTQNRTVASTGLILTGIGKVRTQIQIDGCCSNTIVDKNSEVKLIVRNVDNHTDPLSIIKIFKFEQKKKYRRAEVSSISSLGSVKDNNLEYVPFTGKKFGTYSYIIKINNLEPGEYGITILNPNALDQKQTVVSTFTVKE
jgi:hypothetical protein